MLRADGTPRSGIALAASPDSCATGDFNRERGRQPKPHVRPQLCGRRALEGLRISALRGVHETIGVTLARRAATDFRRIVATFAIISATLCISLAAMPDAESDGGTSILK